MEHHVSALASLLSIECR